MIGYHCGVPTEHLREDQIRFSRRCSKCGRIFTQRKRQAKEKSMGQVSNWIVVTWFVGIPDKDIEYFGPFDSESDAQVFAEDGLDKDLDFKIEPLHS